MKVYFVSLGIGLNMFFTEYFPIGKPEQGKSYSKELKENFRIINYFKSKGMPWY